MKKIVFFLIIISVIFSCRNENNRNLQTGKDYILINNGLSHIIPLVIHSSIDPVQLKLKLMNQSDSLNTCASFHYISGDTSAMNGLIQYDIDFYHGCSDSDGVHKAGIVQCNLDGFLNGLNSSCEVVFDGFQIGGNFLWGGFEIVPINANNWRVITKDLRLQLSKKEIIITDTLLYSRVSGDPTVEFLLDDQFLISSNGLILDRNNAFGTGFSANMFKTADCRWFTQGLLEIELSDGLKQIIDFGAMDCDNEAMFEMDGNQYVIEMQ